MHHEDTIVAAATPTGESAIAVIRVSGPLCEALAQSVFKRNTPPPPRRAMLAHYGDRNQNVLDQVLYVYFEHGASYTGEPMLEISPHGNPLIIQRILEDLIARGCRSAEAGEFTRRAFLNERMDLTQAEAIADMIAARSERALKAAHKRLSGELGKRMEQYSQRLLGILAFLEAYIDFPEEDIPLEETSGPVADIQALLKAITALKETSHYSDLLHKGVNTIIVGPPNAGKSSLLNALVGEERAIVSSEAGTTRDFITERIMLDTHCINIMDTAGLRAPENDIEKAGVAKTLEKMRQADFFLYVIDASADSPTLPEESLPLFHVEHTLVVENKSDLKEARTHADILPGRPRVQVSAKTGSGIQALRELWKQTLEKDLAIPNADDLLVSSRHASALDRAIQSLHQALETLTTSEATELTCAHLRETLDALGDVVGRVDNEQMLDVLFANFCIGK